MILRRYQIQLEDLPSWEDTGVHFLYTAPLCRDFGRYGADEVHTPESLESENCKEETAEKPISDEKMDDNGSNGTVADATSDLVCYRLQLYSIMLIPILILPLGGDYAGDAISYDTP